MPTCLKPGEALEPIGKRIYVDATPLDGDKLPSGLVMPHKARIHNALWRAKVIAVGSEVQEPIHVGDTVVVHDYAGADLTCKPGVTRRELIVTEDEVLAILEE